MIVLFSFSSAYADCELAAAQCLEATAVNQREGGIAYFKRLPRGGPMDSARNAAEEAKALEKVAQYYGKCESSVIVDTKNTVVEHVSCTQFVRMEMDQRMD